MSRPCTDFLAIFSNTGCSLTSCSWRSPTKSMFLAPNHLWVPNRSSKRMGMLAKLRLDTMDISSTMIIFTLIWAVSNIRPSCHHARRQLEEPVDGDPADVEGGQTGRHHNGLR